MTTVSFITFCHPPHLERLHREGVLLDILKSHKYPFSEVVVVHQRCRGIEYRQIAEVPETQVVESEEFAGSNGDYEPLLSLFHIPANDPVADEWTHGPDAAHYWKWHCINHLIGLMVATSRYIVFADCDTKMVANEPSSWINIGIGILEREPRVFCISPNDGGDERYTQNVSQQLFLVDRDRMREAPLGIPWNGKFDAPGGPMQEYYWMLEGRIGRVLTHKQWYRYVLGPEYRYWHYNPWEPT